MKKKPATTEEYPDLNGNGVPDAFENRKSLSEILGFGVVLLDAVAQADADAKALTEALEPDQTVAPTDVVDALTRSNNRLEDTLYTLQRKALRTQDTACDHSQGNTPFLTCVHILKQGAGIGFCENTAPSILNHHIGVKMCALKTHQPKDYCTACDKCMPRHLQGYETR